MVAAKTLAQLWHRHGKRILALLFSVTITAIILLFRHQLAALRGYGYLSVFLIGMLGNATVVFPVPSLTIVVAMGAVLNPLIVGLVAGVGESLGELTGYLTGYGGTAIVDESKHFRRIASWMERRGFLTILVLSSIPNPLFDLAGIAAGMLGFPVTRFLLACWLGKSIKAVLLAHFGSRLMQIVGPRIG
ncbi:MAG: VTT domain-containing protein [Chloroflexota bacterium]|nr:VTT domain-containing protein [Chloroflexota bacterium]